MSERSWKLFIKDVLESIGKIEIYIAGLSYEEFEDDPKKRIRNS